MSYSLKRFKMISEIGRCFGRGVQLSISRKISFSFPGEGCSVVEKFNEYGGGVVSLMSLIYLFSRS